MWVYISFLHKIFRLPLFKENIALKMIPALSFSAAGKKKKTDLCQLLLFDHALHSPRCKSIGFVYKTSITQNEEGFWFVIYWTSNPVNPMYISKPRR